MTLKAFLLLSIGLVETSKLSMEGKSAWEKEHHLKRQTFMILFKMFENNL